MQAWQHSSRCVLHTINAALITLLVLAMGANTALVYCSSGALQGAFGHEASETREALVGSSHQVCCAADHHHHHHHHDHGHAGLHAHGYLYVHTHDEETPQHAAPSCVDDQLIDDPATLRANGHWFDDISDGSVVSLLPVVEYGLQNDDQWVVQVLARPPPWSDQEHVFTRTVRLLL